MYLKLKFYRFFNLLNFYFIHIYNYKYISFFTDYFNNIYYKKSFTDKKKSQILVELNFLQSSLIINSYLLKKIFNNNKSEIVLYRSLYSNNFFIKIFIKTIYLFKIDIFSIYRNIFDVKKIIYPKIFNENHVVNNIFAKVCSNLKSKNDVENIKINEVHIGDLIYDSYLRIYNEPTINLEKKFYQHLRICVSNFIFWESYLKKNKIEAVITSHSVYISAILLRLAVKNNISVYISSLTNIYKLSKKNLWAYKEFKKYPNMFSKLKKNQKKNALSLSKKRLALRFMGKIGVDMHYSTKSAYTNNFKKRLIKNSDKIKILIATHCFFDSPHSYGKNIFPDFYEWLDCLGKISIKTDYDWYIKLHPDFHPLTMKIINQFINKYNKFNLLPSDSSHHQIIKEGIDFVLTIYGSVGHEYPLFNIPVINASINNPHIKYKFNIHPRNLKEYKKILLNLNSVNLKIKKNEVYEYYYMANLFKQDNLSLVNYNQIIKYVGGYKFQFTSKVYKYWVSKFKNNVLLDRKIQGFINNKKSYILYI
jgi:hypothetical protein